jgi:Ni/Fe-hydrogenase subunit HybB-like protein
VSIVWALSIHTVTAFFLNTMPARPMWHHSMMPIRFISTAFAAGPALIILIFLIVRTRTRLWIENSAIDLLGTITTYCLGLALFLTMSEVVTSLYANAEHALGLQYLMFGMHGFNDLVPWFWGSLLAMVVAFGILLTPHWRSNYRLLAAACILAFVGIWIEKGMALLVPGFIPTPIGEFTQYFPSTLEVIVTLGNWAVGFLVLTVLLKGAIGILLGDIAYAATAQGKATSGIVGVSVAPEPT